MMSVFLTRLPAPWSQELGLPVSSWYFQSIIHSMCPKIIVEEERKTGKKRTPKELRKWKQILLGLLFQLCNSRIAWEKRISGSDIFRLEEAKPSAVFPTCHEPFSVGSLACRPEAPELQGSALCHLHAFPSTLTKLTCLGPLPTCWELGKQLILKSPPLLLGSRDSWEPGSCVHSHLGAVEEPPSLLWAEADLSGCSGGDAHCGQEQRQFWEKALRHLSSSSHDCLVQVT